MEPEITIKVAIAKSTRSRDINKNRAAERVAIGVYRSDATPGNKLVISFVPVAFSCTISKIDPASGEGSVPRAETSFAISLRSASRRKKRIRTGCG